MSMESMFVRWYVDSVDCWTWWAWWSCFSPLTGHVSSEALCCPLLVSAPLPSRQQRRAGMGHMAAVHHHLNRCVSDSSFSHSVPFPLSVFPQSIKTYKGKAWVHFPCCWQQVVSTAPPKKKNYCSIIKDGNQRWALITAAGTWCSICFMLFYSFHKAKWAFCVMCSYLTVICEGVFFSTLLFFL